MIDEGDLSVGSVETEHTISFGGSRAGNQVDDPQIDTGDTRGANLGCKNDARRPRHRRSYLTLHTY